MKTRLRSWLIGCGLGCMALVVLGVVGCTSFAIWLRQPGELLEPARLFGPGTTGYAEWTLRLEDPGTAGFVDSMLSAVQSGRDDLQALPGWVRWMMLRSQARDERKFRELFPMVMAWTVHPQESEQRDLHLGTLSIEKLGNRLVFADWMLGLAFRWSPEAAVNRYRGERIYGPEGPDEVSFFLRGSDVFITSNVGTAHQALDMLAGDARALPGSRSDRGELERLFEALPERPLRGVVGNEHGELTRLAHELLPEFLPKLDGLELDEVRAATLSGAFENASDFAATLTLYGPDPRWATENGQRLADALEESFFRSGLEARPEVLDERLVLQFRVPDLPDRLRRVIRLGQGTIPKKLASRGPIES